MTDAPASTGLRLEVVVTAVAVLPSAVITTRPLPELLPVAVVAVMAAVVAGVLVGTRRNHEVSAGHESAEERTLAFVGEEV